MIVMAALGALVVLLGAGMYFMLGSGGGGSSSTRELLSDLGLTRKWSGEATTPFYRWGWTKTSTERVWGERIVKKAFQKAGVWLRAEDMVYFKARCDDHAGNRSVDDAAIIERVEQIVLRNDTILELLTSQLKVIIEEVTHLSLSDAEQQLKEIQVSDEKGAPHARLCVIQLRRYLKNAGKMILNPASNGFEFNVTKSEDVFRLKGMESWVAFLSLYKRSLTKLIERSGVVNNDAVRQAIQSRILHKLLKLYESDILNQESYLNAIEQQIENGELELDFDKIQHVEGLLFGWQFDENTEFNETHHQRFRSFMTRRDLAPVFREMVLNGIKASKSSINAIIKAFPRNIIFIGEDQKARAFAIKFYQYHLQRLFEVFGEILDGKLHTPSPVLIPLEQIKKARTEQFQEQERSRVAARGGRSTPKKEADGDENSEYYLGPLVEKHKGYTAFERKLEQAVAERAGYLINIPLAEKDMLPNELREMQMSYLSAYATFNCDLAGSVDFASNSSKAKQERNEFFKMMLQKLHGKRSSAGGSSNPEEVLDAMDSNQPPSLVSA